MARKYDIEATLGADFEFELTPELLAYELSMDFSNQIIKRCTEMNVSLGEFASRMGIGPSTLSEKLNGQNLTLKSIASMAIALGCDVSAPELMVKSADVSHLESPWQGLRAIPASDIASIFDIAFADDGSTIVDTPNVATSQKARNCYRFSPEFGKAAA